MMTMETMKLHQQAANGQRDLDEERLRRAACSSAERDVASTILPDRFEAMFECSDRTQAGSCELTTSIRQLRKEPLSKVVEQQEETDDSGFLFRSCSTISATTGTSPERNNINKRTPMIDDSATARIVKVQAMIRGYLERVPKGPAPPVRSIRPRASATSWNNRRVSDVTMLEFGDSSFNSYATNTPEGSSEFTFPTMPYSRSRNESIDEDVSYSYTQRFHQSNCDNTFDNCLAKELQHLDISEEMAVPREVGESSVDRDDDVPRPPLCKRNISLDTAFAVMGDAPAIPPVRRDSQYINHDVSSLTEGSCGWGPPNKISEASSESSSSKKSPQRRGAHGLLKRFCSVPALKTDALKECFSLDLPMCPPKRRISSHRFRVSAPAAFR